MEVHWKIAKTLSELNKLNPRNLFSVPKMFKSPMKEPGLPPGTLVHIGEKKAEKVTISLIDYDEDNFEEREIFDIEECFPYRGKASKTWINVVGLHDIGLIGKLGEKFGVHALVLEDILHTRQRPKIEDYGDYIYIVLKVVFMERASREIVAEQISIVAGENFIITFQEAENDIFDPVRERMKVPQGRFRTFGVEYLLYGLTDIIVDNYLQVVEEIGEKIEDMEERILNDPEERDLEIIQSFKRNMIFLRRAIWPVREIVGGLVMRESAILTDSTDVFFRDVHDHAIRVIDSIEMFRDMLSGMLNMLSSGISKRTNEVMKVLTVIATIFMPLTFIVGVYGMNFKYFPELNWQWAYFTVWGVMIAISAGMLLYFRRKKWF